MIQLSKNAALALVIAALLGGCAYDSAQHTDRVGYSAGNAVKANLALQTINPLKKSLNDTPGLGRDGNKPLVEVVVQDNIGGGGGE
jgi:hypothetical protein